MVKIGTTFLSFFFLSVNINPYFWLYFVILPTGVIGRHVTVTNQCVVGAACQLTNKETLSDDTIVYSPECKRYHKKVPLQVSKTLTRQLCDVIGSSRYPSLNNRVTLFCGLWLLFFNLLLYRLAALYSGSG